MSNNRKPQFPINPTTTAMDQTRTSKGKEEAKKKGLIYSKDAPPSKSYQPVLRDDSHMEAQETGFLGIGRAEPTHAYDIDGEWRLLYKKPGEDDKPIGPGMKPRPSPNPSPDIPRKKNISVEPLTKKKSLPPEIPESKAVATQASPKLKSPPPMNICVRHWEGPKFWLNDVKPNDTIEEIQNRIERDHNVPRHHQRLRYGSHPLNDPSKSLEHCNIKHQSLLDLDPMEIKVRASNGVIARLEVDPDDPINDIKDRVKKELGIPVDEQRPNFKGKPLPDRSTLDDNGIKHGDTIDLEPMQIYVREPNGKKHTFDVEPTNTIDEIKDNVLQKTGIPKKDQRLVFKGTPLTSPNKTLRECGIKHKDTLDMQPMEIKVKTPSGDAVTLQVSPDDPISDIKDRVKKELGIPVDEQRPNFKGKPLPDRSTLDDNGIKHGDTIDLEPMQIYVREPNGKKHTFDVEPTDTIDEIKDNVLQKTGIPKKDQRLVFKGTPLTSPSKTLRECGIKHKDTLDMQPMEIKVKTPSGDVVTLQVSPDDPISDIKDRVKKELGIPVDEQRPNFKGKPLPDRSTLDDNGIKHGDTIDLEPMQIYVREPNGKKHTFDVEPTNTIDEIKDNVLQKTGIPKKDQRLVFKGTPLTSPNKTLRECGIKHKDTLDMQPMEIKVKTPSGDVVTLQVSPDDPISDIKDRVKKELGIPVDEQRPNFKGKPLPDRSTLDDNGIKHGDTIDLEPMQIYVREPNGKKHTFDVEPTNTIDEIKDNVLQKTGIPKKDQRLVFKGTPLTSPNKTLRECGIKHKDTLDMQPMEIKVKTPSGDVVTLQVSPDDPISDIKDRVKKELGIPVDEQRPNFKGKPLPDRSTLDDNGIKHGDTIDLEPMQIYVREPNGKKHTFDVEPTNTIDEIKDNVLQKTGIPKKDQRLVFKGTPLTSPNKTLRECGIKHKDTLDMQPMEIKVKTPSGDVVTLQVSPDDPISDIKDRVKKELGIPVDEQRPNFKGKPLPDRSTLDDNGIKHGDTIDLEPMQIYVREPNGKKHTFDVEPTDTIDEIKDNVLQKTGVPKKDQRLVFKGTPLTSPNKTLRECGIKHKDTLDMQPMEIKVKTPSGDVVTLQVSPDDPISDIKDRVKKELGIPVDEQRPNFKGKPLPDRSTLDDNGIKHGDTIDLEPMQIYVREPNGKKHTFDVEPTNTIDEIKDNVLQKTGIPKKDQRLVFKGTPLTSPSKTLRECGIKHKDTLDMQPMEIKVKTPSGDVVTLQVSPDDPISDIKDRVKKELGIPVDEQRPNFKGKPLPDRSTLDDNGIKHGDTIDLEPMEIFVVDLKGQSRTYLVDPTTRIGQVKNDVETDTGIPPAKQILSFNGSQLRDDTKSLHDCGIRHKSTLRLEPYQVNVRTPSGKVIRLVVDPDNTTEDLKKMVDERENIPPKDQILVFGDKKLEDPETLADNGIKNGDTIDLQLAPAPSIKPMVARMTVSNSPAKSPKKPSYLPENWKKERDRYGTVNVKTYRTDYSGDNDASFLVEKTSDVTTKFKVEKPKRKSQGDIRNSS
ncbi:ubiquitin [Nitzschia inconspicua]|uniref:Ubiquitin n=1 Tax=Nitzschia inconspicua TaxID=303405 RepID=A0A9K3KEB1_9STRA|nr:ubiquitin [Nitzschia inconspicua]